MVENTIGQLSIVQIHLSVKEKCFILKSKCFGSTVEEKACTIFVKKRCEYNLK